jgi:hypothetical protein
MKKVILMVAVATTLLFAASAYAGQDEDNDDMTGAPASLAAQRALSNAMLRNQWGSRHTNPELDAFIKSRTAAAVNALLNYFYGPGQHGDVFNNGGSAGGSQSTHSGCGGGCLSPSHPRSQ